MPAPITLLTLIIQQEMEIERIDVWENTLRAEGKCLDPDKARYRAIAKKTMQMLELLRNNREEFEAAVEKRRKKGA